MSNSTLEVNDEALLKTELDGVLQKYEFQDGAVLVQIPQVPLSLLDSDVARNRGYFAHPPVGLLYLSASLKQIGIETRVVDLSFAVLREAQRPNPDVEGVWKDILDQGLASFKKPFVCVTFMFEPSYPEFLKVCAYVKHSMPGVCVAAGGVNATADPERLLKDGLVDLVFSHEGEKTLESFYSYIRGTSSKLPMNISFLDSAKSIRHTPRESGGAVDLDITAEYAKVPIRDYYQVGSLSNFSRMIGLDVPFATVLSRRGCRAHCSFCGVRNFNGVGVRVRDVERVLEEMEFLHREYGIRHFDWLDDDLLFDREAALEMFKQMALRLPDITWQANNGIIAAAITPELMQAIETSGCVGFKVGLESGNKTVLRDVHKPTSLEKFHAFARMADEFPRVFVAVNFILGFPGERFDQMLDSFKAAVLAKLDWNNFYIYQHIRNTELYITYGGLGNELSSSEHGKDVQVPNLNPVRGGQFKDYHIDEQIVSGYDVIALDSALIPSKIQLKEIWFTFNYIANFLRMPALVTESDIRLKNAIRYVDVLSQAYPDDFAMGCTLYYMHSRLGESTRVLEELRAAAQAKLEKSDYWKMRDREFNFSALLEGQIPEIDKRYRPFFDAATVAI